MGGGGEDQENKQHVCKFCKKSFLCGRSLGGHMRSHMMNNNNTSSSTKAKEKQLHKKKVFSSSVNGEKNEEGEDFEVGYVLRENPKKSWRYSDSSDGTLNQDMVCKECGKGFQSWKALFGHMRCHSERDNKVSNSLEEEDDDSWTTGDQNQKQLIMDSQSDNEATAAAAPRRRMRTRRRRYNITATTTTTTTSTTIASSSLSLVHTSTTCVSEIEQEQEEVALCLMMLSRDVGGYWGGLNSVGDFSDNDSVVLEIRSSGLVDGKKVLMNGEKIVKMKKPRRARKLEFGLKKVESEVSVHGFFGEDSSKRPKLDFEVLEAEKSRVQCTGSELIKDLIKEDQADSVCVKYNSSKRTIDDAYNTPKKRKYDGLDESEIGKSSRKKPKYECTTCNKTFHSYQALGGHRASHKKIKGCSLLKLESSENSIDTDVKSIKDCSIEKLMDHKEKEVVVAESSSVSKNSNKHECPTCFKVFLSGQALGGHKRSHVIESSDIRGGNESINAVQQKLPEIQDLLDLNLPAPIEDDMKDDHIGFKPWWVGSNLKHEPPPVSMISH